MLTMDTSPRKPPPPPLILEKKMSTSSSSVSMKIKPQSAEALNLLSGISDMRLKGESAEMADTLLKIWHEFWDVKDQQLEMMQNGSQTIITKEQLNKI